MQTGITKSTGVIVVVLLILLAGMPDAYGQRSRDEAPPLKERIFFAGNMGLQFGTYTNIQLAPAVGMWVLPRDRKSVV